MICQQQIVAADVLATMVVLPAAGLLSFFCSAVADVEEVDSLVAWATIAVASSGF